MKSLLRPALLASVVRVAAFDNRDFELTQVDLPSFGQVVVPGWRHLGANGGGGAYWNLNAPNLSQWAEATVVVPYPAYPSFLPGPVIAGGFSMMFTTLYPLGMTVRNLGFLPPGFTGSEDISSAWIGQTGLIDAGLPRLTLLTDYRGPGVYGAHLSIYFAGTPVAYTLQNTLLLDSLSHPLQLLKADLRPFGGLTGELRIGVSGDLPHGSFTGFTGGEGTRFIIDNLAFVPEAGSPWPVVTLAGLLVGASVGRRCAYGNRARVPTVEGPAS